MKDLTAVVDWIRPWYPAGFVGHLDADCEGLLAVVPQPTAGPGWLNPFDGETCAACLTRHGYASWEAACKTCGATIAEDFFACEYVRPFTEADAKQWMSDHTCLPVVELTPPPKPAPLAQPAGQTALFALEPAA